MLICNVLFALSVIISRNSEVRVDLVSAAVEALICSAILVVLINLGMFYFIH